MSWQATRGRESIEGQDHAVGHFLRAAALGRIAGAYLFIGPPGVGKTTVALALAKALECERPRPGLVACGGCGSCVQSDAGTHPDIDVVSRPPDRATIPLEAFIGQPEHRMREGLCWRLLLRPVLGPRRVAIVLDADHLSDEAANCLLKTLEEPPPGAVIILVGTAIERQLPTIRSRCQIVRFRPLDEQTILRVLAAEAATAPAAEATADESRLREAARGAGGSLARARLLLDPDVTAFRGRLATLLGRRPLAGVELARETLAVVEAAGKEAPPRRQRLRVVLEAAVECFRHALRAAATGADPGDAALARAGAAWAADEESAAKAVECTLAALDGIDRNLNLTILVDAWTAELERVDHAMARA